MVQWLEQQTHNKLLSVVGIFQIDYEVTKFDIPKLKLKVTFAKSL